MLSYVQCGDRLAADVGYRVEKRITGKFSHGRGMSETLGAWNDDFVRQYFGRMACAGSFNIILNEPVEFLPSAKIAIVDGCRGIWPATVFGHPCLVERWPECPLHIVECISDVKLRDLLGPSSSVEVTLPSTIVLPAWKRHLWQRVWGGKNADYYSDAYWQSVRQNFFLRKAARFARQRM